MSAQLRPGVTPHGPSSGKADMTHIVPGTPADQTTRTSPAARTFFRVFALLSGLMVLWALATPLMAYPDEPVHTIKAAAVARGQIAPEAGKSFGHGLHVQVPSYIANLQAQTCFAFHRDRTAGCAPEVPADDNYLTIGVTSAGLYNPMYYWLVGLPSLFMSGAPAVFAMRILSALLSAAFYAAGFTALSRLRHPKWPIVAAALATTPMVLFLASGINPNSLEVAATMAAFCGFLVVLENSSQLRVVRPAVITVAVSIIALANTRAVSLVWLLCAVVVACVFYRWKDFVVLFRNRVVLVAVGVAAVGVALGMAWNLLILNAPPSAGAAPPGISNVTGDDVRPYNAFLTMLDRSFDYVIQYVGVVGWLDTPMPQAVLMFWNMLLMLAILMVFLVRHWRLRLGFLAALAALLLVPSVMQAGLVASVGFIWQGRYSLPLFLIAVIAAGMAFRFRHFPLSRPSQAMTRLLLLAGAIAHVYGFLFVLRRYVVGLPDKGNWQTMITVPGWQPPFTWEILTLVYAITVLIGAGMLFGYLHPGGTLLSMPGSIARLSLRRKGSQPANGQAVPRAGTTKP